MYWIIGAILLSLFLIELAARQIKDPSEYERERELNPYDSYYVAKDEQRHKGMKFTAIVMALLIAIALISFFSSCSILAKSPRYEYEYLRLWDGTTGRGYDIAQYDLGDTVEEIPSGRKYIITGIALPGQKMIHAQTKFEK